jgi:hypothetical protein
MQRYGITFLKYKLIENDIFIGGDVVERVSSFKLLGVWLTNNLSWDIHGDKILKKANSRIYALRLLKKAGLSPLNIVHIYCAVIRSQLEYASPVWSALPKTLSDLIESVQKRALKIAYPTLSYDEALQKTNIKLLSTRREEACKKLINSLRDQDSPHNPLTAIVKSGLPDRTHNYDLRNNNSQLLPIMSERLKNFLPLNIVKFL